MQNEIGKSRWQLKVRYKYICPPNDFEETAQALLRRTPSSLENYSLSQESAHLNDLGSYRI